MKNILVFAFQFLIHVWKMSLFASHPIAVQLFRKYLNIYFLNLKNKGNKNGIE